MDNKYYEMVYEVLGKYCGDENISNIEELPEIKLVENIFREIEKVRPDMAKVLDKDEIEKCSGYTLFLDNGTEIILVDKSFFNRSIIKNLIWVEVLLHEITHVQDYKNNRGIYGHDSYDSMIKCLPFWYWTEFHACYKGTFYMLHYVNGLPDDYKKDYEKELLFTLKNTIAIIESGYSYEMKRYHFMHLLGEIAAYREQGFSVSCEKVEEFFPDYSNYVEFLRTKDQVVDTDYITILDYHLRKNIS